MSLKIENVAYTFKNKDVNILKDICIDFNTGITTIMGINGSGKSTLLNLLNLVDNPTEGTIYFGESTISKKTKHKVRVKNRKYINMVYQFSDNQIFNDTVKKELYFNNKRDKKDLEFETDLYLKKFGFDMDVLNENPLNLSGGEKKKIAFISILLLKPSILLLDEPTIGLDLKSRKIMMDIIKEYSLDNKVIMVCHNLEEVNYLANEIVHLANGKVIAKTTKKEFFYDLYKSKDDTLLPNIYKYLLKYNLTYDQFLEVETIEDVIKIIKEHNELYI